MAENKEFERGRAYESKSHRMGLHMWLGYGCTIFGLIFLITWIFLKGNPINYANLWTAIFLLIFGLLSLYLGYHEKKELKK